MNKAPIEALALSSAEEVLHAPYKWSDVAWYDRGPRPGDTGRATIFGHLDSTCCPAVFWHLKDLKAGDIVQVTYRDGKTVNFRVMWQAVYWDYQFPMKFVFGRTQERGLVMYTCNGVFHYDGSGYDHKVLIYARMILPNGHLG